MNWLLYYLRPYWLTGPILDKEMRVSSRRRRTYVVRVGWVCLLMMFVALFWGSHVSRRSYQSAFSTYSFAEMAQVIVLVVSYFGFIMAQLLGIVLMSTSISDEIYRRTLGVLMTTSINSVQIVIGKLLGRLLQIMLLLAVMVPVLAVIRVFGGVPWEYILATTAVTICATIFCSSLSMLFSIFSRRAYWVILQTLIALGLWYVVLPFGIGIVLHKVFDLRERVILPTIGAPNPIFVMAMLQEWFERPRNFSMITGVSSIWLAVTIHCGIVLALSAVLIVLSMIFVRRAALRQAMGESGSRRKEKRSARQTLAVTPPPLPALSPSGSAPWPPPLPPPVSLATHNADAGIRRVWGWPVMWKEMRAPLFGSKGKIIGAVIFVALLLCSYLLAGRDLNDRGVQALYVTILTCLGILSTAILSATGITTEREARSWDVLLVTGMSDWQIILGKAAGALRKSLVAWGFLALHLAIFLLLGKLDLANVIMIAMLAGYLLIFWTGAGIMFSCLVKHTTTAVVLNIGLAIALYIAVPLIAALACQATRGSGTRSEMDRSIFCLNPAVQGFTLAEPRRYYYRGTYYASNIGNDDYRWPDGDASTLQATAFRMVSYTVLFTLCGAGMAAVGRSNMRRCR